MFDFDAGKLLIVGIVALLVIGPKELPRVLRQLGQWTGKLRRMASEFQGQFMDAMREADLDSIKQEVANVAKAAEVHTNFNPIADINREVTAALESKPAVAAAPAAIESTSAETLTIEPPAPPHGLADAGASGEAAVAVASAEASASSASPIPQPLPAHLSTPSVEPAPRPFHGPGEAAPAVPARTAPEDVALPFPDTPAAAKPPRVNPSSLAARRNAALAAAARKRTLPPGERAAPDGKRDELTST